MSGRKTGFLSRCVRRLTALFAAGAAIALIASTIERTRVHLDRYTVPLDHAVIPPEGITVLHLSDLHCRADGSIQGAKLRSLRALLDRERYDLAVITGDLIHNTAGVDTALTLMRELRPRWGSFSCLGNRDYWESSFAAFFSEPGPSGEPQLSVDLRAVMRRAMRFAGRVMRNERASLHYIRNDVDALNARLREAGCEPLVNDARCIRLGDAGLWIAGLDDLREGTPDLDGTFSQLPGDGLTILLSHNPDVWMDPRCRRADLILAGHTHGGQINLPWVGALYTQGTHLSRMQPAGWFVEDACRMFISRGIGESFPLRLGAPPQIALIRIVRPDSTG